MNISRDDKDTIHSKLESKNSNNDDDDNSKDKLSKALAPSASSSSTTTSTSSCLRQWSGFKNPRIVRVSRTFGGKDRHSKVCTIRGLRDRRIRLSVPTAVQLYDLQDRLGLSQPSKVIDWLLDATKVDIDKLPPLKIPPGSFAQFHQQSLIGQLANAAAPPIHFTPYLDANLALMKEGPSAGKEGININDDVEDDEDEDEDEDDRSIEAKLETIKWNNKASNDQEDPYHRGGSSSSSRANASASVHVSAPSFFPNGGSNNFLQAGLMNSMALPYSSLYHWDPANLSLSQFGSSHGPLVPPQSTEEHHQSNNYSGGGSTHQLFFCPPVAASSLFPQHENRFHLSNNTSLSPFQNAASGLKAFTPHHDHELQPGQPDKGDR